MDEIVTFDKQKLDKVFRKKVIEIEEKNQREAMAAGKELSDKAREKANRKLMEKIISNLIGDKTETEKEPDVYEAYQLILAEHYKKAKKPPTKAQKDRQLLHRTASSRKSKKRMSISTLNLDEKPKRSSGAKNKEGLKSNIESKGRQRHQTNFS